jgi:branched-chain amino acid transport system permease protein
VTLATAIQQSLNAVSLGGIYALLALGLAVVYSIVSLINFAHGELMTVAGYGLFFGLTTGLGLPVAIGVGIFVAIAVALATERFAFRPMRRADVTGLLITSFAVSLLIRVALQNFISARPKPIPMPEALSGAIDIGFATIGIIPLLSILTTLVALIALTLFLRRTMLGTAMRAGAEDFTVLRLMGIRANLVIALAFAISGGLAGIAGVLWIAERGAVDPLMGMVPVLKAFVATVIGGLGSLSGAVLGGFTLGILEVLFQAVLPDAFVPFRDAFVLATVIAILIMRPRGLLPAPTTRRP